MPVYHRLQWTPEPPKEKYQGPIDGVRPEDHPETYQLLRSFRCIIAVNGRIYQSARENYRKICEECHHLMPVERKREYTKVASHNLVHENTARTQSRCTICNRRIIIITPAHECTGCIEEYLHADKNHLRHGWGVRVVKRWIQRRN